MGTASRRVCFFADSCYSTKAEQVLTLAVGRFFSGGLAGSTVSPKREIQKLRVVQLMGHLSEISQALILRGSRQDARSAQLRADAVGLRKHGK